MTLYNSNNSSLRNRRARCGVSSAADESAGVILTVAIIVVKKVHLQLSCRTNLTMIIIMIPQQQQQQQEHQQHPMQQNHHHHLVRDVK